MDASKQTARNTLQIRIASLNNEEYQALSCAVYENASGALKQLLAADSKHSVLLYAAVTKWREVALSKLEKDYTNLQFEYVSSVKTSPLPETTYDIIFVPLYGFTADGYRLGHGGGWYDRFLQTQPGALKIGVGLEIGRIDFTVEPHDIPVDVLVTEDRYEILRKRSRR